MADLPYNYVKLNDIEVSQDSPVTESLVNKIGGAANLAIDKQIRSQIFDSNGTFTVPTGVTRLLVAGIGGGGGGGGSGTSDTIVTSGAVTQQVGGQGGGGHAAILGVYPVDVTPAQTISVTVGAGGAGGIAAGGDGAAGGNSTFGTITFPGGHAGLSGSVYAVFGNHPVKHRRGGASAYGNGGSESAPYVTGGSASSLGAGGAGGYFQDVLVGGTGGPQAAGGAGAQGRVIVYWAGGVP